MDLDYDMKLVCLGAKNPHTIKIVNAVKNVNRKFQFLGFIDNDRKKWGTEFYNYPVFGGMDKVKELTSQGAVFCNLITGSTKTRFETTKTLLEKGANLANLIHPSVDMDMVSIGTGNYIQEGVKIQAAVKIGNNSSIHQGSLIPHECSIGDSVFIAHGVTLSGEVVIEDGAFIGAGAIILPKVTVGKWAIVGAGSLVTKDVASDTVVVGVPAKPIRKRRLEE